MNKAIWILVAGVVVAVALWYYQNKGAEKDVSCAQNKPGKFPKWDDTAVPHGDLGRIAAAYLTPNIGGDNHLNGSLVGGFFKSIDVYPSMGAAQYYQRDLIAWASSSSALPYWQTLLGEFICEN